MGVQFFGGMFYKCVDATGATLSSTIVPDRNACISLNYQWMNSHANFDNALNGFLALLEVVSNAYVSYIVTSSCWPSQQ